MSLSENKLNTFFLLAILLVSVLPATNAQSRTTTGSCGGYVINRRTTGCCANKPFTLNSQLCCINTVHMRRKDDICCGNKVFSPSEAVCCDYEFVRKLNGIDYDDALCCAGTVVDSKTHGCQDDKILTKCSQFLIDEETHMCCAGVPYAKSDGLQCCGKTTFNPSSEICCTRTLAGVVLGSVAAKISEGPASYGQQSCCNGLPVDGRFKCEEHVPTLHCPTCAYGDPREGEGTSQSSSS